MPNEPKNNAQRSLAICSSFESEILLWLMLRNWDHPLAENLSYRGGLLETIAEVLDAAANDSSRQIFVEGLPTAEMNFVAAAWYAESCALGELPAPPPDEAAGRERWLANIRRALPSCFCPQGDLS